MTAKGNDVRWGSRVPRRHADPRHRRRVHPCRLPPPLMLRRVCGLLLPRRQRRGLTTMTDHTPRRVRICGNLCHPTIPAGAVRVTRPTCWSNPYPVAPMAALRPWRRYRQYLTRNPT